MKPKRTILHFSLKSYPHVCQLQCWEFQEINFCSNLLQSIVQTIYIDLSTERRAYSTVETIYIGLNSH
jgi:hypothetical protein